VASDSDYFLAGRSLGLGVASISIFATWFGSETCIGSAAAIYDGGLSGGRADPFGYTLCLLLSGLFFASVLWRANITTLGDLFRVRYSPSVEHLAAIIIIPTSLLWAAAQLRAFGQILASSSSLTVPMATTIATGLVIAYTVLGGLLADAITDVIQGAVILLGLIVLGILVVMHLGGIGGALAAIDPARLSFIPPDGEGLLAQIETWSIPIFGSLVAQELLARTCSA